MCGGSMGGGQYGSSMGYRPQGMNNNSFNMGNPGATLSNAYGYAQNQLGRMPSFQQGQPGMYGRSGSSAYMPGWGPQKPEGPTTYPPGEEVPQKIVDPYREYGTNPTYSPIQSQTGGLTPNELGYAPTPNPLGQGNYGRNPGAPQMSVPYMVNETGGGMPRDFNAAPQMSAPYTVNGGMPRFGGQAQPMMLPQQNPGMQANNLFNSIAGWRR